MNDFADNTWVAQKGVTDESEFFKYCLCLYWAFQTLTTVGYGDFGAYNSQEILITIIWMVIGVAFYTFVVAALTSAITAEGSEDEKLQIKILALDMFAQEHQMDDNMHDKMVRFL